jgi:hypothetical protein
VTTRKIVSRGSAATTAWGVALAALVPSALFIESVSGIAKSVDLRPVVTPGIELGKRISSLRRLNPSRFPAAS